MADKVKDDDIYESCVDYSIINKNIKKYRQAAKLNQSELAEKSHITSKYLSRLENNYYKGSLHVYIQIANALNISIYDLMNEAKNNHDDFINRLVISTADMSENQKNILLESIQLIKRYKF